MRYVLIHNLSRPTVQTVIARVCSSFWCRLRGLILRAALSDHDGLLLTYARDGRVETAIHMLGVRTDLAVVWITGAGRVVDTCLARRGIHMYSPGQPARYVLEMAATRQGDFNVGEEVSLEEVSLD